MELDIDPSLARLKHAHVLYRDDVCMHQNAKHKSRLAGLKVSRNDTDGITFRGVYRGFRKHCKG